MVEVLCFAFGVCEWPVYINQDENNHDHISIMRAELISQHTK